MKAFRILCLFLLTLSAHAQSPTTIPPSGFPINQDRLKRTGTGWIDISLKALDEEIKAISWTTLKARPAAFPSSIPLVHLLQERLDEKANLLQVYTRGQADVNFLHSDYVPTWTGIAYKPLYFPTSRSVSPDIDSALANRPTRNEISVLYNGGARDTTAYPKTQADFLFARKGSTLEEYNILNAYTKGDIDSKLPTRTLFDAALSAGYVIVPTSFWDNSTAVQAALSTSGAGSVLAMQPGTYKLSSLVTLPDGMQLVAPRSATITAADNFASVGLEGNEGGYLLRAGNNSVIDGVIIDGKGFSAGGILVLNKSNVTVQNCVVKNLAGTRFGITVIASPNANVLHNTITDCAHAINIFRSDYAFIRGNFTNRNFSGIYSVASSHVQITGNTLINNEDVGADIEKGTNNTITGNYSEAAKNGELAFFDGGGENAGEPTSKNVVFSGNTLVRTYTYQKANPTGTTYVVDSVASDRGACAIWSIDPGAFNVGFDHNNIYVERGYGFTHPQVSDKSGRYVFFSDNKVYSKSGFVDALNSDGLHITGNTFEGMAGSEGFQNTLRDGHGLVVSDNHFTYQNAKTTNPSIYLLTLSGFATKAPLLARNSFVNTGTLALRVDLFNNGGLKPVLHENSFSTDYVINGGLSITTNGPAVLRDQKLKVLLPTGNTTLDATIDGFSNNKVGPAKAMGTLAYGTPVFHSVLADFAWSSGQGFVTRTYNTVPNLSIGGSFVTITLTNTGTGTAFGYLDVTVNSF
jgi:hypothetical protein